VLVIYYEQAFNFYRPKKIAITGGYHGVHLIIDTYKRGTDVQIVELDAEDYTGVDLCWVETPLNPTGEARFVFLQISYKVRPGLIILM
jgi:cystathionine gamma-synthase